MLNLSHYNHKRPELPLSYDRKENMNLPNSDIGFALSYRQVSFQLLNISFSILQFPKLEVHWM